MRAFVFGIALVVAACNSGADQSTAASEDGISQIAPACRPNWVRFQQYQAGDVVRYPDGNLYIAKFANPGDDPTISTYFWSPYSGFPQWAEGTAYSVGDIVKYTNGKFYIAKFANPGYNPTISTYFWAPYVGYPNWVRSTQYQVGDIVQYRDGYLYVAKVANPGYDPTISTYFWAPLCGEVTPPHPAPPPPPPPTAAGPTLAPYFTTWGGAGYNNLTQAKQVAGLDTATLAFGITHGTCALDTGIATMLPDIKSYIFSGGRLIISFGGAGGTYVEVACSTDDQIFDLIDRVIIDTGSQQLDFDVEGLQLSNMASHAARARVLARLQAKYPNLYVSFTLTGWFNGLGVDSLNVIKTTLAEGVRIDIVNVMTMSFGAQNIATMISPPTLGQATIATIQSTVNQLRAIYPTKTSAQIYAMTGITPMIGTNDDGTTFTLNDATTVAQFAKQNGIGRIAYWAFQRDQAQSVAGLADLNAFSGVVQSDFQFYELFKTAQTP